MFHSGGWRRMGEVRTDKWNEKNWNLERWARVQKGGGGKKSNARYFEKKVWTSKKIIFTKKSVSECAKQFLVRGLWVILRKSSWRWVRIPSKCTVFFGKILKKRMKINKKRPAIDYFLQKKFENDYSTRNLK